MKPTPIRPKRNLNCVLRPLQAADSEALADYFCGLTEQTRARFGPHPLTREFAQQLCARQNDTATRYVVENKGKIIGYFILEYAMSEHEAARYHSLGIDLQSDLDPLFAPSIADAFQSKGIASAVMPLLIEEAMRKGARSLVLMGGTQEGNLTARNFYAKFGFKPHGGFQTDSWNIDMRLEFGL